MGYEKVELIDTTDGMFMSRYEAAWMMLSGSALLSIRMTYRSPIIETLESADSEVFVLRKE